MMTTTRIVDQITFEWDTEKARINPINHDGVTFEEALEVFSDPGTRFVDASREGQRRFGAIGYGNRGRLLFVVHLELDVETDVIRIISAWKATRSERLLYEEGSV